MHCCHLLEKSATRDPKMNLIGNLSSLPNHPYGNKPVNSFINGRSLRAKCDTLSMKSLFMFQRYLWNKMS